MAVTSWTLAAKQAMAIAATSQLLYANLNFLFCLFVLYFDKRPFFIYTIFYAAAAYSFFSFAMTQSLRY